MMRDEKCVKCGSDDLIRVPIVPGEGPHIAIGDRIMHAVPLTQIVCGACGYIEMWVEGSENLARLRDEYGQGK
jgi:predicted nucleic-acid-binding Zn-ribbon protein